MLGPTVVELLLPGCVSALLLPPAPGPPRDPPGPDSFLDSASDSADEARELMHEAIPVHIESRRSHGESVPPPLTQVEYVEAV